jgi:hypothetical protein
MKTSRIWNYRPIVGKIMMALVFAAMIGIMDVAPALAKDNHKNMGYHDNGRYERGRGYDNGRYGRGRGYDRGRYGYRERVYAPPTVFYAPPPPPGIGIFFPFSR